MAVPVFTFYPGTGSDTAASGAGPGTALTGTAASYSGSGPYTITLDGSPDLSGVATDGSHVLFLATDSGRRYFTIEGKVAATSVDVTEAPAGTTSGLSWAIGGELNSLDDTNARQLIETDFQSNWSAELKADDSLSSAITPAGVSGAIRSDTEGTLRTITQTANAPCFQLSNGGNWEFADLKLQNSNGTKTSAYGVYLVTGSSQSSFFRCILGDSTNTLQSGIYRGNQNHSVRMVECAVVHCGDIGVGYSGTAGSANSAWTFAYCVISNNGSHGINLPQAGACNVVGCLIAENAGCGFIASSQLSQLHVYGNTFVDNTSHGISFSSNIAPINFVLVNNIIAHNGGSGLSHGFSSDQESHVRMHMSNNNWYTNASGAISGSYTVSDMDSQVDPGFTDRSNDDYSVGTAMKAAGAPDSSQTMGLGVSSTSSYVDIGAAQRQEPAGGGTTVYLRGSNTLLRR